MTTDTLDLRPMREALERVIADQADGLCIVDEPLIGHAVQLIDQAPGLLAALDQLEKLTGATLC